MSFWMFLIVIHKKRVSILFIESFQNIYFYRCVLAMVVFFFRAQPDAARRIVALFGKESHSQAQVGKARNWPKQDADGHRQA